jgi:ribosomal protein L10
VGGQTKKSEKRIKKEEYWQKLWKLTEKYKKALLVDVDNVSSLQLNKIRFKLRSLDAKMIMGKNVSSYYTSFQLVDLDESRS